MHKIWNIFWRALRFFARFAVCHFFTLSISICATKVFTVGEGKGGFFPIGVAVTVPH